MNTTEYSTLICHTKNLFDQARYEHIISLLTPFLLSNPSREIIQLVAQCYHQLGEHEEAATVLNLMEHLPAATLP